MSREVEVQNIQMMATVPEDIQISLGAIGASNAAKGSSEDNGTLTASTGYLVTTKQGSVDLVGGVAPPENTWDWSNTADISAYYQFGRLIPASSNTGENIYFTPDAAGVGRTLKDGATFYQAVAATAAYKYQAASGSGASATPATFVTGGSRSGDDSAMATAHVVTAKTGATVSDAWSTAGNGTGEGKVNYAKSTTWDNDLNDDRYYVDIPIWIRTSATGSTTLSVKGWVAPKSASSTAADKALTDDLYKAVRVAILDSSGTPSCKVQNAGSILPLADGMNTAMTALATDPFAGTPILDAKNYTNRTSSVSDKATLYGRAASDWATYTAYTPTNAIATLTGPTVTDGKKAAEYGTPTQIYIRVWLEGEDENCWNETAGQDWSINLKFEKLANTTS